MSVSTLTERLYYLCDLMFITNNSKKTCTVKWNKYMYHENKTWALLVSESPSTVS